MNVAVNRALALRPSLSFCVSCPGSVAFVSTNIMLGRARDRANCAPAPANAFTSKPDLAKQLFPSSSPSGPEVEITSWVASDKPHSTATSSAARTARPLAPGSGNSRPSSARDASATSNATAVSRTNNDLVSVCSNAGSFEERPLSLGKFQPYGNAISSVFLSEEDFSDDNTLELDYECPATLPPPATSQIPWSSSPPQHMFPPVNTDKRKGDTPNDAPPKPAKRRVLPKTWAQPSRETVDEMKPTIAGVRDYSSAALALPSKTAAPLWDATQTAVKEQQKQFKNQSKKSQTEFSPDEITSIVQERPVKKAIALSSEQLHVVDLVVKQKQSVFFTGPAGTGKSVLMRTIISELKKKWARDPERLCVTASTGLAACNIGGQTLHSFAGIGLGKEDVTTLVRKIRRNMKAKNRWLRVHTLIIDEVSMVDGELFDKLSQVARTIRNNGRPFGGIQLVITGDFFQLPPVPEDGKHAKFAFDAATWNTSIDHTIGLTQIFRQKDPQFATMLNEMRLGKISDDTVQTFKSLARPLTFDDGLDVTELFPTRNEVERSNDSRLGNLPGEAHRYDAYDTGDPKDRDRLLSNMMAPKSLILKKDAQVMLIKNMDDTLVNGSLGKVIGFMAEATFENWATSLQGTADDDMDADGNAMKKIKAYSRVGEVVKDVKEYPVVRFTASDGTHRIILCVAEDFKVERPTGELHAGRKQLPLILAWALSIHKAQGQTLERVRVDLGKAFEKGQAYVALSRAVSKQGLQVLRFEKNKVMAHPRVMQFYNNLYSAESAVKAKKTPNISEFAYTAAK